MSYRLTLSLFLLLAFTVVPACKKDDKPTIIKGRITDIKTGEPIKGARTVFTVKPLDNSSGNTGQYSPPSDINGEFICTLESDYVGSEETSREGYVAKYSFSDFVNGQTNNMEWKLVPRDGFLRLKVENSLGQHDTMYVMVYSRIEDDEGFSSGEITPFPLILSMGENHTEVIALPSPEMVAIKWSFKKPAYQIPYTFRDSILVTPNDTATYILSY